ncbi:MAG: hypothetical protein H6Q89_3649 [Myxococcaceae bacterium]|nr:hypothetical protein [Myxococcaceae bacterium]
MQYFVARDAKADPISLLFLDYVRRKHALTALDPIVDHLKNAKADPTHPDVQLMLHLRTYARLADPSAAPSAQDVESANSPLDRMALEALYCDRDGPKDGLLERLRETAAAGKYYLTHAALYTGWAVENGCLEAAPAKALQAELAQKMSVLIAAEGGPTDLAIEAMAFLFYVGHRELVRPEWIQQVRAAQRKDGGWTHGPASAPTNDHSSFLALWVLLDATRPNTADRPWLR